MISRRILSCLCLLSLAATGLCQVLKFDISTPATGLYGSTPSATCRDSSGNVYITGTFEARPLTEKLSKTGAVAWRNYYVKPKLTQDAYPGAVLHDDASGDTVVVGSLSDQFVAGQSGIYIEAITSGGSMLWQMADYTHFVGSVAMDSDGNLILAAPRSTGTAQIFDLIKYSAISGAVMYKVAQSIGAAGTSCSGLASDTAGDLYALVTAGTTQYVVRYNEASGAILWKTVEGAYSGFPKLTPLGLAIMPGGDALVTGAASNSSTALPLYITFDRIGAAHGAFVNRRTLLMGDSNWHVSNLTAWQSPPATDAFGNVYTLNEMVYSDYFHAYWVATKAADTFALDWSTNLDGAIAPPSIFPAANGGAYVGIAPELFKHRQEIWYIASSGGIIYQKPSNQFGEPDALSLFQDDPSLVGGAVPGAGDGGYGFGFQTFNGPTGGLLTNAKDDPTGSVANNLTAPVTDAAGNFYTIDALTGPSPARIDKYNSLGTWCGP